jgi:hypothetical protein
MRVNPEYVERQQHLMALPGKGIASSIPRELET